ncbi:MAG: response regulator [Pseudomonadota bacterium]
MTISQISRIMLVDDSDDVLEPVGEYLRLKGYQITTARNGRDALEKLETDKYPLIITDINMPEMSGPELLDNMSRSRQSFKAVVISAYFEEGIKTELRKKGAYAFLQKPFSFGELETVIQEGLLQ